MSGLKHWIHLIEQQELPIFRYTINAINNVVSDEDSSTARLAQVILQDASLTARILRIANSATYNPTGSPINTVSRAIVFIGFNMVRDLSLTLAVIEALLNRKGQKHIFRLMARAFHAAVQARAMAIQRGDDAPEEVFIAALLYSLGEMAFWCVAGKEGEEILALIEKEGLSPKAAQKQVLGFTFEQLTVALTQDWHLSDLLHSTINNPSLKNPRVRDINDSQRLSAETEKGWDSRAAQKSIEQIAQRLEMEPRPAREWLKENTLDAVEIARLFGAGSITEYLPIPNPRPSGEEETPADKYPVADPVLQLSILRDLSRMLEKQPNLNLILETILEGIYRGCGMDRTLFALLTPDKKQLRAKHALGEHSQQFTEEFVFNLNDTPFFNWLFRQNDAVWIKDGKAKAAESPLTTAFLAEVGTRDFLACPLSIKDKPIGILYADRAPSGRKLDSDTFESFRHFYLQAKMAINYISGSG
ncbi:MAG: HDOD domain-containing protein [Thiohalophilus sp.]|uniref:HDOD domain-containing protein n=1 Tax=Thiohalophilus sp. TaxID=3028392 RepID=UPI0028704E28|nr:HDOD domain-containing protein [Thiohalophilus sp.]MDR9435598.1 HDOD domain-containing protein [Thiohalophilus sp.]